MKPSLADYEQALDNFVQTIGGLRENGRSVLLYGSMARGEVIPGHSDLDFWVILAKDVFRDRTRFQQAFAVMLGACQELAASGLPVIHAFCYYSEDEIDWLPAALVPNLRSPRSSRIVSGEDVRAQMGSTAASRHLYRTSYFFEMRHHIFLPLAPYLKKEALAEKEARHILGSLKYIKYLPEAACAALDLWPGEIDAIARLGQELNIDVGIVACVEALRTQDNPLANLEVVQATLRQASLFVEQVHDALVARRQGER